MSDNRSGTRQQTLNVHKCLRLAQCRRGNGGHGHFLEGRLVRPVFFAY